MNKTNNYFYQMKISTNNSSSNEAYMSKSNVNIIIQQGIQNFTFSRKNNNYFYQMKISTNNSSSNEAYMSKSNVNIIIQQGIQNFTFFRKLAILTNTIIFNMKITWKKYKFSQILYLISRKDLEIKEFSRKCILFNH